MRGKVTDQQLTEYALNELSPIERMYVESMLAVSEECRDDVYQMLDMSEMLREGFETQEDGAALLLKEDQRVKVLTVPRWHWRGFIQRAAAVALLASGAVYVAKNPQSWQRGKASDSVASVGASETPEGAPEISNQGFAKSAEEYLAARMQAVKPADGPDFQFVSAPAVCTPPVFSGLSISDIVEM